MTQGQGMMEPAPLCPAEQQCRNEAQLAGPIINRSSSQSAQPPSLAHAVQRSPHAHLTALRSASSTCLLLSLWAMAGSQLNASPCASACRLCIPDAQRCQLRHWRGCGAITPQTAVQAPACDTPHSLATPQLARLTCITSLCNAPSACASWWKLLMASATWGHTIVWGRAPQQLSVCPAFNSLG